MLAATCASAQILLCSVMFSGKPAIFDARPKHKKQSRQTEPSASPAQHAQRCLLIHAGGPAVAPGPCAT